MSEKVSIVAVSDLHGHLPELPKCDIVIIAGDMSPAIEQNKWGDEVKSWWEVDFKCWIADLKCRYVIAIAGNHDFICQAHPEIPKGLISRNEKAEYNKWHYLQDEGVELMGLYFWGTPWQPPFFDWAFNLPEPELAVIFKLIPTMTDVLITHGPPQGILDITPRMDSAGSSALRHRLDSERLQPQVHIFGHIHSSYGAVSIAGTRYFNAALTDERYRLVQGPHILEVMPRVPVHP